jgi:hypothetical protein
VAPLVLVSVDPFAKIFGKTHPADRLHSTIRAKNQLFANQLSDSGLQRAQSESLDASESQRQLAQQVEAATDEPVGSC